MSHQLTPELLASYKENFYSNSTNRLAQNVCTRSDPLEACLSRKCLETNIHVFNHKVETEGKPVTNQKSSGRCWLFACLNVARQPFVKHYNLEDFEFSQAHLFYWDKIERANYFLQNIILTAKRGEDVTSRTVSYILNDPINDGGQWDMVVNLVTKHGLMPKKCFPETFSCESSSRLNGILKSKLREYAKELRGHIAGGASDEALVAAQRSMMGQVYTIVGICLGIPPDTFTWQYADKAKQHVTAGPMTPLEFYNKYVKPVWSVEDKVCLVSDPRSSNPFGRTYTVDCLGNMVGGQRIIYNNQPIEVLMNLTRNSIMSNEAVWFGCEVSKRYVAKQGFLDITAHDYELVFGVDVQTGMDKANRLVYGDSLMTHAMVFTGCHEPEEGGGGVVRWRVENSWGEDRGEKGYLMMTSDWFKEFVFEIVVDKSIVPPEILAVGEMEPIILPAWDPLGALAK